MKNWPCGSGSGESDPGGGRAASHDSRSGAHEHHGQQPGRRHPLTINPSQAFYVHERGILRRLADEAAAMYAELENTDLRGEIARLERKLDAAKPDTKNRRRQAKGSTNGDL